MGKLGCGIPLAGLADGTALPFNITHASWCSSQSVLTAGSRQSCSGRAWGAGAERSRGSSVTCQQGHATCMQACQLSQFSSALQPGDSVMVVPTLPDEEAKKLFPKGVFTKDLPSGKKYLRYTPQPE